MQAINTEGIKFERYPAYKDSGVEWLGEIPAHWGVEKLKFLSEMIVSNVDKHEKPLEIPVKLCNYVDVYKNDFITKEIDFMSATASKEEIDKFKIKIGDVLITKDSEDWKDIGVPSLVKHEAENLICGYHLAILRPGKEIIGSFLHRAMQSISAKTQLSINANGITRYGISQRAILSILLTIPPLPEQTRIATFLGRKTALIDKAIAQKERLIGLLQERRQVLIDRVITSGLNQNVPMKNSGVEWIGDIPAHWEVRRSKFLFTQRKERARKNDVQLSATQAYGVIPQDEYERKIGRRVVKIQFHLDKRKHVEVDDFVISMRSFQGGLERAWSSGCIRSSYVVLRPLEEIDPGFYSYLFKSSRYIRELQSTASFIRDGQDLNFDNFSKVDLFVLPLEEQHQIATYLDNQLKVTEKATSQQQLQIEKLKEYKATLIDSAVTGKIKVN
ncbi:MAG: restriction endonuclease subunit S [Lewinellaceae bacterium]|nr:restriction endonuclease subunit S [Lewinellaceae bacterium]